MKAIINSETGIHRKYSKQLSSLKLFGGQEECKAHSAARQHGEGASGPPKDDTHARATPGVARRGRRPTPQATPPATATSAYRRFRLKIHIREIH